MQVQTTHTTLLARLSRGEEPAAWREFCKRYGELIRNFARRQGLQEADCDDVLQDVLLALTKSMPGFRYDPAKGKFRSYLKTVVLHTIFRKSCQTLGKVSLEEVTRLVDVTLRDGDIERAWDEEWRQYHLHQAMSVIDAEFNDADRRAFQLYALDGQGAKETAEMLGMSAEQVYQAKSRITKRLSQIVEEQVQAED